MPEQDRLIRAVYIALIACSIVSANYGTYGNFFQSDDFAWCTDSWFDSRPVTTLYFDLGFDLLGGREGLATPLYFGNSLLLIVNALLVSLIIFSLTANRRLSMLIGFLLAVNPVNHEMASTLFSASHLILTLFLLIAMLVFKRLADSGKILLVIPLIIVQILGGLSAQMGFLLPIVLASFILPRGHTSARGLSAGRSAVMVLILFAAAWLTYYFTQRDLFPQRNILDLEFIRITALFPLTVIGRLSDILLGFHDRGVLPIVFPVTGFAIVLFLSIAASNGPVRRVIWIFVVWMITLPMPMAAALYLQGFGSLQIVSEHILEHDLYIPSLGFIVLLGVLLYRTLGIFYNGLKTLLDHRARIIGYAFILIFVSLLQFGAIKTSPHKIDDNPSKYFWDLFEELLPGELTGATIYLVNPPFERIMRISGSVDEITSFFYISQILGCRHAVGPHDFKVIVRDEIPGPGDRPDPEPHFIILFDGDRATLHSTDRQRSTGLIEPESSQTPPL
ncbi:hypothetical protein ACFL4G_04235 [Thermodesulfobacteriota bacterium]